MRSADAGGSRISERGSAPSVRREPPARRAFAVAGTFIAVGFIVLGTIQVLGVAFASYNPNAAMPLIYLSIAIAVALLTLAGFMSRVRS